MHHYICSFINCVIMYVTMYSIAYKFSLESNFTRKFYFAEHHKIHILRHFQPFYFSNETENYMVMFVQHNACCYFSFTGEIDERTKYLFWLKHYKLIVNRSVLSQIYIHVATITTFIVALLYIQNVNNIQSMDP